MPIKQYEKVQVTDRSYNYNYYQLAVYEVSKKVNIVTWDNGSKLSLKLSKAEAEELIVRLQFALYELDN